MSVVREVVSKGASSKQLEHEVKLLTKAERETLLESAMGDMPAIAIPADQVLAMKADLSITWNKLRVLRRLDGHTYHIL